MRVLLICDAGDGLLDLALRAQHAGHVVRVFIRKFDRKTRPIGQGLVERVADWRPHMDWCDLAILEGNGVYMADMDAFRARGCRIIGGNAESASWELDRTKGMKVFRAAGIPIPEFREFTDYDSAISFVERRGEVYYSKPCSDTADKSLSAKTGTIEAPAWMLRKWKKKHGRPPCPFLLQEGIDGIEFAAGAWFGPGGFAEGWEENFEHKRFCAGDIGPNTGEMGTVMRYVRKSRLAEKVLVPLEHHLDRIGYVGNVDVNCIIDDSGSVWPLEFTMRLGWPAFNIETDLFACDPIEFFHALASGESTRGAHHLDTVAVGVVLALPPYPHPPRDYEEIVGVPMYGAGEGWHPCEMMSSANQNQYEPQHNRDHRDVGPCQSEEPVHLSRQPDPKGNVAGGDNNHEKGGSHFHNLASAGHYLGVAVGTGATVREAARGADKALRGISMPASPFWRNDIGRKLSRQLPQLQEHGFARGLSY